MTVQNHLAFQFVPILLDVIMLYHDDHHINLGEELIEVQNLVLHNLLLRKERIESFQGTG